MFNNCKTLNDDISSEKAFARIVLVHIIGTYRREKTLSKKLESLKPLLSDSYRIIVVDNVNIPQRLTTPA